MNKFLLMILNIHIKNIGWCLDKLKDDVEDDESKAGFDGLDKSIALNILSGMLSNPKKRKELMYHLKIILLTLKQINHIGTDGLEKIKNSNPFLYEFVCELIKIDKIA